MLSHQEQAAYFAAVKLGVRLLTAAFLCETLGLSSGHAAVLLHRLATKGVLERVGHGKYAVVATEVLYERKTKGVDLRGTLHALMTSFGLADQYYIGFQSAAQLHGAAHQQPFVLQVASVRQRLPTNVGQETIQFVKVMPSRVFGIEDRRYRDALVRVSDRERTALDLIDRANLGGGIEEAARTVGALLTDGDVGRLAEYAARLQRHSTAQRLGLILERLDLDIPASITTALLDLRGSSLVLLEPSGSRTGPIDRRWRVRLNVPLDELS